MTREGSYAEMILSAHWNGELDKLHLHAWYFFAGSIVLCTIHVETVRVVSPLHDRIYFKSSKSL